MKYEKDYIDFLIQISVEFPLIKPILDDYFLDNIAFESLVDIISERKLGVTPYMIFKKNKNIDEFLKGI